MKLDKIKSLLKELGFKTYSDKNIDPKELEMGIEVEKEHTTNPEIARIIALAHLNELPDYYTKLKKMEKGN